MSVIRVLVAEDNIVLSDILRFNLSRAGLVVAVARNIHEAKTHLGAQQFDLMITDFQMPDGNGDELCRFVREECQLTIPIILCSAKGLEINAAALRDTWSLAAVIFKPFSMSDIVKRVCSLTATQPTAT